MLSFYYITLKSITYLLSNCKCLFKKKIVFVVIYLKLCIVFVISQITNNKKQHKKKHILI